jgi:transcription antitermination factor NusG
MEAKWFTLCTKRGYEKKVAELLKKKEIEAYCPLKKVKTNWSFKRYEFTPVIPGFIFVKVADERQEEVKNTSGVINFMYWLNEPAVVKEKEIELLKRFLSDYKDFKVDKAPVGKKLLKVADSLHDDVLSTSRRRTVKAVLSSIGYVLSAEVKEEVVKEENVAYMYPNYKYFDAI